MGTAVRHTAFTMQPHPSHVVLTAGVLDLETDRALPQANAVGGLPDNWRRAAATSSSPPRSQPAAQAGYPAPTLQQRHPAPQQARAYPSVGASINIGCRHHLQPVPSCITSASSAATTATSIAPA